MCVVLTINKKLEIIQKPGAGSPTISIVIPFCKGKKCV
jgi:hypothetical protein